MSSSKPCPGLKEGAGQGPCPEGSHSGIGETKDQMLAARIGRGEGGKESDLILMSSVEAQWGRGMLFANMVLIQQCRLNKDN